MGLINRGLLLLPLAKTMSCKSFAGLPATALIVLCWCGSVHASEGNLVVNPQFQTTKSWTVEQTAGFTKVGPLTSKSGQHSYGLGVLPVPRKSESSLVSQVVNLEQDKFFVLNFTYQTGYGLEYVGYEELYVALDDWVIWRADLAITNELREQSLRFKAPGQQVKLVFGKRGLKDEGGGWDFQSTISNVQLRSAGEREIAPLVKPGTAVVLIPEKHMLGDEEEFNRRMANISDEDFFRALNLEYPKLSEVRQAVKKKDYDDAYLAFGKYIAQRSSPKPSPTHEYYRKEIASYWKHFPKRHGSLNRVFNGEREWTVEDADRVVGKELIYAGNDNPWVKFDDHVDWVNSRGNIYGFHYMESLQPLTLAYLNNGDEKYARAFADIFDDWWEQRDRVQPQWCVWYKLGWATRSLRLMEAYLAMSTSKSWSAETHRRILKSLLGGQRWLYKDFALSPSSNNWGLFVAQGQARVGTLLPEFCEAANWVKMARETCIRYGAIFKQDGGTEAIGYHLVILDALLSVQEDLASSSRPDLLSNEVFCAGLSRGYDHLLSMVMPNGYLPAIGDSFYDDALPVLTRGAAALKRGDLKDAVLKMAPQRIARDGAVLLPGHPVAFTSAADIENRLLPQVTAKPFIPKSVQHPQQGVTLMRHSQDPSSSGFLAITHGAYNHCHPDYMGLILFEAGKLFLHDAGTPNYYGPHADEMKCTIAHNTLTVDRQNQQGGPPKVLLWRSDEELDIWRAQSDAYGSLGVIHLRTVVHFKKPFGNVAPYYVVLDEVRRSNASSRDLDVFFHTQQSLNISNPRQVVMGSKPYLTLATPLESGIPGEGEAWSVDFESSIARRTYPYVSFGVKKHAGAWVHVVALAVDNEKPRQLKLTLAPEDAAGLALGVQVEEAGSKDIILILKEGAKQVSVLGVQGTEPVNVHRMGK